MKTLIESLAKIQRTMNAPKNQHNSFGHYNYRSCEDILQAVKPLLGNHAITITDTIEIVGERYYVKATATFTDGQNSLQCTAFAREALTKKGMDDSQVTGSTSSYARKYALNGLLLIDDNKDADSGNPADLMTADKRPKKPPTKKTDPAITPEQHKRLEAIIARLDLDREWVRDWLKIQTGEESPHLDARSITQSLYTRLDRVMEDWAALETEISRRGLDRNRVIAWVEKATKHQHLADLTDNQRDRLFDKLDEWTPKQEINNV